MTEDEKKNLNFTEKKQRLCERNGRTAIYKNFETTEGRKKKKLKDPTTSEGLRWRLVRMRRA